MFPKHITPCGFDLQTMSLNAKLIQSNHTETALLSSSILCNRLSLLTGLSTLYLSKHQWCRKARLLFLRIINICDADKQKDNIYISFLILKAHIIHTIFFTFKQEHNIILLLHVFWLTPQKTPLSNITLQVQQQSQQLLLSLILSLR